jgi:hypothetical protein
MENLRPPEQLIRPDFLDPERCLRWGFRHTRTVDPRQNLFEVSLLALHS